MSIHILIEFCQGYPACFQRKSLLTPFCPRHRLGNATGIRSLQTSGIGSGRGAAVPDYTAVVLFIVGNQIDKQGQAATGQRLQDHHRKRPGTSPQLVRMPLS